VDLLITAMQTKDSIEIHVVNIQNLSNENDNRNNNNNNNINNMSSVSSTPVLDDSTRDKNEQKSAFKRLTLNTSQPNLFDPMIYPNDPTNYNRSESVPGFSTGSKQKHTNFQNNLSCYHLCLSQ